MTEDIPEFIGKRWKKKTKQRKSEEISTEVKKFYQDEEAKWLPQHCDENEKQFLRARISLKSKEIANKREGKSGCSKAKQGELVIEKKRK